MIALTQITQRPLIRPTYAQAETYEAWIRINGELVMNYWRDTAFASGEDPDRLPYADLYDFAQDQFKTSSPTSAATADKSSSHGQKDVPHAGPRTAGAGIPRHVQVMIDQYRQDKRDHEVFVNRLWDLVRADKFDDIADAVRQAYLDIHGPAR